MIYGFSTIRVKNKSAIVIYLLSHQDFSAIILAVNENYSSIQLSDKVVNTRTTNYFSLSNSSVRVHKWTKLIMFPRSFLLSTSVNFPIISSCYWVGIGKEKKPRESNSWNRFRYRPPLQRCKQFLNFYISFIRMKTFDLFGDYAIGTHKFRLPLPSSKGRDKI